MWVAVYVLAILILMTSSVLFGYLWCQSDEAKRRAEAQVWARLIADLDG